MANNFGLGRGLASLIPQKRKSANETDEKVTELKKDPDYRGASFTPGVSFTPGIASALKTKEIKAGGEIKLLNSAVKEVEVFKIVPNPHQPRLKFNQEKLKELAESIREHGIIQPLIVSQNNNQYEIIAGERRLEAAKLAGLKTVPAIVRDATERQKLELAITENIQRHDLNPIEEAKAYKKLADEFDLTQEEIAQKLGKSRPVIANKLRLLNLPTEIQRAVMDEKITDGHAKAILAITDPEKQRALFEMILKNNLTVRQTESKVKETTVRTHQRNISVDPETQKIEDDLAQKLGTKVKLQKSGGGGKIVIEYYSQEELNGLLDKLS